jgi:ribose transport system substrate-binding protein
MKKAFLTTILVAVMVISFMACTKKSAPAAAAGGEKTDGFVIGMSNGYFGNTWRAQHMQNYEDRAQYYKDQGIIKEFFTANTDTDVTEQINQLNAFLNNGCDAILINPAAPNAMKPVVDKALQMGVLVVMVDSGGPYPGTYCVFGDNVSWQRVQAVWLAEQLGGKGEVVEVAGVAGAPADVLRQAENRRVYSEIYPDIKIIRTVQGRWSPTEAQQLMTTILSSNISFDGIISQDVMSEGIIKAYENAGKTPPVMTGDYVKSFFVKWKTMPNLVTMGIPYPPGISKSAVDVTIKLLQGRKFKPGVLKPHVDDPSLVNCIYIDAPYVVTKEAQPNAKWMEGLVGTKAIGLDEALEILKNEADSFSLDGSLSEEVIESFFE